MAVDRHSLIPDIPTVSRVERRLRKEPKKDLPRPKSVPSFAIPSGASYTSFEMLRLPGTKTRSRRSMDGDDMLGRNAEILRRLGSLDFV